jgi:hypothetical protein
MTIELQPETGALFISTIMAGPAIYIMLPHPDCAAHRGSCTHCWHCMSAVTWVQSGLLLGGVTVWWVLGGLCMPCSSIEIAPSTSHATRVEWWLQLLVVVLLLLVVLLLQSFITSLIAALSNHTLQEYACHMRLPSLHAVSLYHTIKCIKPLTGPERALHTEFGRFAQTVGRTQKLCY